MHTRLPYSLLFTLIIFTIFFVSLSSSAPAVCRSCSKNCSSGLDEDLGHVDGQVSKITNLLEQNEGGRDNSTRVRRSTEHGSGVVRKPCNSFTIEMILIPLSIAMIPIGLCALLLCTCCCGPEENRGKLPENFLKTAMGQNPKERINSEDFELEYKDGYVQRKDSSRTKFSTVVSIIEHRRDSAWSIRTNASVEDTQSTTSTNNNTELQSPTFEMPENRRKLGKVPSNGSMVRFSDQVSVLGVDELSLSSGR